MSTEKTAYSPFVQEQTSNTSALNTHATLVGTKMPTYTLTAIGSHRTVELHNLGKPAVLVFCTRETALASEDVNRAIDKRYILSEDVFVGSVVDLNIVPWIVRFIAEAAMQKSYEDVVSRLPSEVTGVNRPPEEITGEEFVFIMPDWDGAVTKSLALQNIHHHAAIVVLNAQGTIVGIYQGDAPAHAALALLETAYQRTT